MTVLHHWHPTSPCGVACLPAESGPARALRVAWRVVALVAALLMVAVLGPFTMLLNRRGRHRCWQLIARSLLRALGVRVQVRDLRPPATRRQRGVLVVSNHVSFLDGIAVAAVCPSRFVIKREAVMASPTNRFLAWSFGLLPHPREELRALPGEVARVTELLDRGRAVTVFPEGTTRCGSVGHEPFRPAFFQSAIDAGVPVQPMTVAYSTGPKTCTAASFVGDDEVGDTLRRVLRERDLTVRIVVHPLVLPAPDRRRLAAQCENVVNGGPRRLEPMPVQLELTELLAPELVAPEGGVPVA